LQDIYLTRAWRKDSAKVIAAAGANHIRLFGMPQTADFDFHAESSLTF
jgi:hypothetical protein